MCGIFAYINHKVVRERKEILATLINGLKRLEYRGYDSAGLACDTDDKKTITVKRSGKVANLEAAAAGSPLDPAFTFEEHVGIAHTRWATHGPPNEVNCHPHQSNAAREFTVVHNGIITNSQSLRALLERKGYKFISDTDTESIAVLCQYIFDEQTKVEKDIPDFSFLVEEVISQLEGSFAMVFKSVHYPNMAVATRRGSPLLIGVKDDKTAEEMQTHVRVEPAERKLSMGSPPSRSMLDEVTVSRVHSLHNLSEEDPIEFFLASDAAAIIEHTKRILFLQDDDVATICAGDLSISRGENRPKLQPTREIKTVELELHAIMKGSFEHYMLKEIYEQPESTFSTMRGRLKMKDGAEPEVVLGGLKAHIKTMLRCRRLLFIACGTSYNSAIACRQWLEETTQLPVVVDIASDFLDRECPIFRDDVCFFISQSGETADTLGALRYCKDRGALVVGITNTVGSSISRESECGVHVNAGPEIGVASTKAYTSQILVLILFGLMMCEDRMCMKKRREEVIQALAELPEKISACLKLDEDCKKLAQFYKDKENLLLMGRGYNFANCLEGSLKIKELAYIHTEGILAGELKHGPLALIDEHMPIIMLILGDASRTKSMNALEQVVARSGRPLIIYSDGDSVPKVGDVDLPTLAVPKTVDCLQSIMSVIPLQLLSYHMACAKGYDVDCPRNLAKSVTVE
mmetsp:Transcript_21244/g.55444  ORF Transcript_21244/g.55444 Transcript_21244/m.55444 type:complete len:690 (+) Transcript_21244:71-2140(+)